MELDSVFQIKKFCREFYERKIKMSKDLVETLDALNNERPATMKLKKRHFEIDNFPQASRKEILEWMRLQAEKDRLSRYKNIAVSQVSNYYNIIEQMNKLLGSREDKKEEKLVNLLHKIDLSSGDRKESENAI